MVCELVSGERIEIERCLLGSAMLYRELWGRIRKVIDPLHFHSVPHRIIYIAALDLFDSGKPCEAVHISEELENRGQTAATGGDQELIDILNSVPHAAHAAYYVAIMRGDIDIPTHGYESNL